jgi:hypothetical protein
MAGNNGPVNNFGALRDEFITYCLLCAISVFLLTPRPDRLAVALRVVSWHFVDRGF